MSLKNSLKRAAIPATVGITGACVLVVEIVATRILAPYFGNTIFSVTSVISVVLAALAIGYYTGGKLADRHPNQQLFYGLVFAGGISVFVLYWLQLMLLPTLAQHLPLTTGPLVVAIILFFVPGLILGTLSPFAIKLQQMIAKQEGIGSISGVIFFYSTMGSIFGSLLAGYVLIPHLGVRTTLVGVGVVLLALGLIPLLLLRADRRFLTKIGVLALALTVVSAATGPTTSALYSHDGIYEKIRIIDGQYGGKPTRFLYQDRSASGAMYLGSDEHVYDYTKYYALYEVFTPQAVRILVIGGGAYTMPKSYLQDLPHATIDVAEIEPSLIELSERYFDLPKDVRLNHYVEDGRRLLKDKAEPYDLIFGDAYHSLYSIPTHLTTKEFFQTAYDKLNDNGVFVMNIIGSLDTRPPSLIYAEIRTLRSVFPNVYLFAVDSTTSPHAQNLILVAHKSDQKITFNPEELATSRYEVVRTLNEHVVDVDGVNFSQYPIITDDYAPVESWTADLLRRYGPEN